MPAVALINLGCSKNIVDGERIIFRITQAGYSIAKKTSDADIIIVNTCAFIREAQEEAIENILLAAQVKRRDATLIVSGCFSERFRTEVASKFPEVDIWAGVNDWEETLGKILGSVAPSFKRTLSEPCSTQYLKIAEGCSHQCSFCVIPSIRGPYTSREIASIIEEAKWLESNGTKELILVAQDSSFYGKDCQLTLATLLETILASCTVPWIRIMYLHPHYIDIPLLNLMASEQRICNYLDMPLQHISDPILRSMGRHPLSSGIYHLIDTIRSIIPNVTIRSSFICGYPGETEHNFRELVKFIEWAKFDKLGVFPFSPEKGTIAAKLPHRPRTTTSLRRCETIMLAQRDISRTICESLVGKNIEVIIDALSEDPEFNFIARSRSDAPEIDGKVMLRNGSFDIGDITNVDIIDCGDYDLIAETSE